MVILGAEPMIVDTGMATGRDIWFEDVFSLVQPEEVRWIFLTHLDCDHAGNLVEALERCPDARLITSHGESFRTAASCGVPFERMLLLDNGEDFSIGGGMFRALRPPVYDSPYTRGLLDHRTGVYYASDAFCAPMPAEPVDRVSEIAPLTWAQTMAQFHYSALCPWVALADPQRFRAEVDQLAASGVRPDRRCAYARDRSGIAGAGFCSACRSALGSLVIGHITAHIPRRRRPPMADKIQLTEAEWLEKLGPEKYRILRQAGTEPAFTGAYEQNKGERRISVRRVRGAAVLFRHQI